MLIYELTNADAITNHAPAFHQDVLDVGCFRIDHAAGIELPHLPDLVERVVVLVVAVLAQQSNAVKRVYTQPPMQRRAPITVRETMSTFMARCV